MPTIIILIAIILIAIAIYALSKSNNSNDPIKKLDDSNIMLNDDIDIIPYNNIIRESSTQPAYDTDAWPKVASMEQDKDENWILNPNLDFKLTLINADKTTAQFIKDILDADNAHPSTQIENLVPIFIMNKLKVKEIEEYKAKFRNVYLGKLTDLKSISKEYNSTVDEDEKEDILSELRFEAEELISEPIGCSLYDLFEREPKDFNVGDDLIMKYGFDSLQLYFQKINRKNKIILLPPNAHAQKPFEKLVSIGLAVGGNKLDNTELLSTLTLNELNNITSNKFTRKNKAVEYICNLENSDQFIKTYVPINNVFKLIPIEDNSDFNIDEINLIWEYYRLIVDLLVTTYNTAYWSWRRVINVEALGVKTIYTVTSTTCSACRVACNRDENIKYTKENLPILPFHIGCSCALMCEPALKITDI